MMLASQHGFLRTDGGKGIRNYVLVLYLVECARFVAEGIARAFDDNKNIQVIGWSGCYSNPYGARVLESLTCHANVGGVLLVSLGCEGMDRYRLHKTIEATGRWVDVVTIQAEGGTRGSIEKGISLLEKGIRIVEETPRVEIRAKELIVGLQCGGSDATSGITANPAMGRASDSIIEMGGTVLFAETGEMIGLENILKKRGATPDLVEGLSRSVQNAKKFFAKLGQASIAPGNADGELTTIEEKSMGAYLKSGSKLINGIIPPNIKPKTPGLYLVDTVPEDDPVFGFSTINDNHDMVELISCGAHLVLFSTGRGSVSGSAVSPVIKICANPETYACMADDMDVNAGAILTDGITHDQVRDEILREITNAIHGKMTASEALGHSEYTLTYKSDLCNERLS